MGERVVRPYGWLLVVLAIWAAFLIATVELRRESLWNDEAWTAWAVHSPYVADTLGRVRADVHPPLYFLLIDGWTLAAGDSVYSLRLFSALCGMIGLAATYAVGVRLFDRWTGFIGLVVLGTASFFVYYTREARMYSLLLALSAVSTLLYLRWREVRATGPVALTRKIPKYNSLLWGLFYGLSLAALAYTHYAGVLIAITHILHWVVSPHPKARLRTIIINLLPYVLAVILFGAWLPTFLTQMRANPNGPLAIPIPTDWGTVAGLVLILTGGNWWLYLLPFVLGRAIPALRQYWRPVLLLVIWLLLTPTALLILNALVAPVYQVRYAIAMLPAGALLVAYAVRQMKIPKLATHYVLPLLAVGVLAYSQLTIDKNIWSEKPQWETVIRGMMETRQPLEPIITDFAPYSPSAYYDRQLDIRRGVSLDLSWRLHSPQEVGERVNMFQNAPPVWVALPVNTAKTWQIVAQLDETRTAGYQSSLVNMIFYRFDPGDESDLQFRFGDAVQVESAPLADETFVMQPDEPLCVDLGLTALKDLDNSLSAGLHLVDITGTQTIAQWDEGLGVVTEGSPIERRPCLTIQAGTPAGHYHLELVIYEWATLERLRLIEDGSGQAVAWGDVLMLAAVDVPE